MPRRIDPALANFARQMRAEPTPFEQKLWQELRGRRLGSLKFSRQIALSGFICDFVCRDRLLIVEIDGDTHDPARDADRDELLGREGYLTLRFTNREISDNLSGVLETILSSASTRKTKVEGVARNPFGGLTHPPTPSLGREGGK